MSIKAVISEVLKKRHQNVPMLEQTERELLELSRQLDALRSMASDTADGANVPPDFRDATANIANQVGHLKNDITELLPKLANLTERFRKPTINIGVAGNARQGKSTVLQHISGLTDQEIPTSNELPCTGAKSKIYHFDGDPYAEIEFYSADEFFRDIILPYFQDFQRLNFPMIYTLKEFEKPLPPLNLAQSAESVSVEMKYNKLAEIHQAFPTFKHLLSTEKTIPLAEISEYVTQRNKLYLAVKTAYIYTKFPNHDVTGLCFVDLPGMEAAQYHEVKLALSLKQEVDAVIFLKRPDPKGDQWQKADLAVLDMIASAAPEIELSNWLFIVLNEMHDPSNAHLIPLLQNAAPNRARQSNMLVSNCKDWQGSEMVFEAVLKHLEQNLEKIDRVLLENLTRSVEQIVSKLTLNLSPMLTFFHTATKGLGPEKKFRELFRKFYNILANSLEKLVKKAQDQASLSQTEKEFIDKVKEICDATEKTPPVPSIDYFEDRFRVKGGWYGAVEEELHHLRSHLTKHLSEGLDVYLEDKVSDVFSDVLEQAIPKTLHSLLSSKTEQANARVLLKEFHALLDPAEQPKLCTAFEYMLRFNFSYQSHFHYRVRRLMTSVDPISNPNLVPEIVPPNATIENVEDISRGLSLMYLQSIAEVRKEFIDKMRDDVGNAIFALVEEIRDQLLFSENIEDEWWAFLYLRRGDVWPDEFSQFEQQTALRQRWQKSIEDVLGQCRILQTALKKS